MQRGLIVHEWLAQIGGSEKVVERLAAQFTDAPIHALWNEAPDRFATGRVEETWLARSPLRHRKALALPLMPATWRHLGPEDADWILCSSHLFAHHARFSGRARDAPKLSYVYTPARYIWEPELDERGRSLAVRTAAPLLRRIDKARAQESQAIAGISTFVRDRIRRSWDREAEVIYPPVEVGDFVDPGTDLVDTDVAVVAALPADYLLGASRFVPYKRMDLVVRAGEVTGLPVVLAGSGPELAALRALAEATGVRAIFVDRPSHRLLVELYRNALAYVFPAVEDFGIMPVEAMATGTPVIGRDTGGVAETVVDGVTGFLLQDFDRTSLRTAIDRLSGLRPGNAVARAWEFDAAVFDEKVREWIERTVTGTG